MINHARNWLLNQLQSDFSTPGEEIIDPLFRPIAWPMPLAVFRQYMFGTTPDRFTLNYYCAQLMNVLHSVRATDAYIRSLDNRLTYLTSQTLFGADGRVTVSPYGTYTGVVLSSTGSWSANRGSSTNSFDALLSVQIGSTSATVTASDATGSVSFAVHVSTDGAGNFSSDRFGIAAGAPSLVISGNSANPASTYEWRVTSYIAPSASLLDNFKAIPPSALTAIVGQASTEPQMSFYNLFTSGSSVQDRIAAVGASAVLQLNSTFTSLYTLQGAA